jgi:hypothetical protein
MELLLTVQHLCKSNNIFVSTEIQEWMHTKYDINIMFARYCYRSVIEPEDGKKLLMRRWQLTDNHPNLEGIKKVDPVLHIQIFTINFREKRHK